MTFGYVHPPVDTVPDRYWVYPRHESRDRAAVVNTVTVFVFLSIVPNSVEVRLRGCALFLQEQIDSSIGRHPCCGYGWSVFGVCGTFRAIGSSIPDQAELLRLSI